MSFMESFITWTFIIICVLVLIYIGLQPEEIITAHWQNFYDGQELPAKEFYAQVKAGLKERKIDAEITFEYFLEKSIFSGKREYLSVEKGEYVFYICAAPYGAGTFISSWLCIKNEGIR